MPETTAGRKRLDHLTWIMGGLAVALVGLGIWFAIYQSSVVNDIQQSRIEATWNNCQSQNRRNRNTKVRLDGILAKVPDAQQTRAQASRIATGLLIDALAPRQKCDELLQHRFGVKHP